MAQQGNFIQPAPQFPQYQNPQQQYYPNAYPPSPAAHAFIQPHPSPDFQRHAPTQQHDPLARAFMPPPSAVPEDITKRRNLQPQRPQNLWPRELSEEQRQIQDQYTRHTPAAPVNPYYAQQPSSTAATPIAPVTSFAPSTHSQPAQYPRQHSQSPASTSQHTPSMTAPSLPTAALTPAPQSSSTIAAPNSESAAVQSAKPPTAQAPNPQSSQSNGTQPQPPALPNSAVPQPQLPSPFEAQRVSALLDINRFLLLELSSLQVKPSSPTEPSKGDGTNASQSGSAPQSSPHYVDYMRRLQSNLAYLASVADRPHKPLNPIPAWPAIMNPPARKGAEGQSSGEESEAEKEVRERYEGLKELWPEWKGKTTTSV